MGIKSRELDIHIFLVRAGSAHINKKDHRFRLSRVQETKVCASAVPFPLTQNAPAFQYRPVAANTFPCNGRTRPDLLFSFRRAARGPAAQEPVPPRTTRRLSESRKQKRIPRHCVYHVMIIIIDASPFVKGNFENFWEVKMPAYFCYSGDHRSA